LVLVAFKWFARWGIGSAALCALSCLLTFAVQGANAAAALLDAWMNTFNGILVGAAGYGAVFFLCRQRGTVAGVLDNVFDVPRALHYEFAQHLDRVRAQRIAPHVTAVVLTAIGGFIACSAGIPLKGLSHWLLTGAVLSFYCVGAYGLMVIVALLRLFHFVDGHLDPAAAQRISLKRPFRGIDVQTIDLFFVISSAMCIFAVYICFRTTITAFAKAPLPYYKAMIIPVFFFLPAALVYSFYPRYVLRQVWEADTFLAIDRYVVETDSAGALDLKSRLELRKLILEVKERMLADRRALPLLSFKDAPTLTLSILMLLQLVAEKDPVIAGWFK
jgi:hypothetical protein